jgi:hypothetical protein
VAPLAFDVPEIAPIELNPAFEAVIEALTYSVVAIFVELSLVAGVGAVGVPVNVGELIGAFNNISAVFAVILAVFAFTLVGKVAMVLELTPPTLFTVVAKLPLPDPVTSPVKVVVAVADITSVPITSPKFVLASAAVVAPVPPFATAIVVPLQVPEVIVPTLVKPELITLLASVVPVNVFELVAIVISELPSKATPLMFLEAASFVAVLAFPLNGPVNPVALIVPLVTTLVTEEFPN